jgi:hypothetical protein
MLVWLCALAALAGWAGLRTLRGYAPPPTNIRTLAPREYALVATMAETVFPRGGRPEPSGVEAGIAEFVDRYLRGVPSSRRRQMRLLFACFEHATLLFPARGRGGMRRFTDLSPEARARWLAGWEASRLASRRLLFTSLRAILTMGYFQHPRVLRALDLAPRRVDTPICQADLLWPRVGELPETIRHTRADVTAPGGGAPLGPGSPLDPDFEEPQ